MGQICLFLKFVNLNSMPKYIYAFLLFVLSFHLTSRADNKNEAYQYIVDLVNVKNDMVKVELIVPVHNYGDSIEFQFPKIVPGTYSIYDFGRFVNDFAAFDEKGMAMPIRRLSPNRWQINDAQRLHSINYWVEDSYDTKKDTVIFEPAGTNIEEGENYLLNNFGIFGYLEGLKRRAFDLEIVKPEGFYGATPLQQLMTSAKSDRFLSVDYYELIDSPIMYTIPDTASIYLGKTEVVVSVYSPNKIISAEEVMQQISQILNAQAQYLGGDLPVDKYVILIYLFDKIPLSKGSGALEHSYSTVLSMREQSADKIAQGIIDVTAHEFFHMITPLTIHSEEIHNFDFQNPQMSQHLWLYEGLTEYAAGHVQLKEGLLSFEDYLRLIRSKIRVSKRSFNDTLAFTRMSEGCLDEYKKEYPNVYFKGALIGLCLDIKLRAYSEGEYGTQNMMKDLSNIYGKDEAFKDEELFDRIEMVTYPQIEDFFQNHVDGNEPLPLKEILEMIGVNYFDSLQSTEITFGDVGLGYNAEKDRILVRSTDKLNDFGKEIGFEEGDEIIRINGILINGSNFNKVITQLKNGLKSGDELKFSVVRYNKKGKEKEYDLIGSAVEIKKTNYHVLEPMENPSSAQLELRKAWGGI